MPKRLLSSAVVALPLSIAFLWVGSEALGRKPLPEPFPAPSAANASIGVVTLEKLLDGTNEAAKWKVHLSELERSLEEERNAKEAELKRLEEEIRKEADPAKRELLTDEGVRKKYLADEWLRLKMTEIDRERSLRWQAIYKSIREEVKAVAEANKIDVVLVDDSISDLKASEKQNQSKETQILGQILSAKVLYASGNVDLTEQVITRINNRTK
jgi:Skp family chaperone for outer membrane proteins